MPQQPFLPEQLYGVIGWPLAQSLSPLLHNAAFAARHLPAVYMRWEVPPARLAAFIDSLRLLRIGGCSVTLPHKMAVMPLLDQIDPQARLVGAVNTLYWNEDKLCGENTDVTGFLAPLAGLAIEEMHILLLGAGGAAHAVAAGLQQRGCRHVFVCTPSNASHKTLAQRFGLTPIDWEQRHSQPVHCVINTTPLGMHGKFDGQSPYDFAAACPCADGSAGLAYDIVYNPLETRFLHEARQRGWQCINGLEMFHAQGAAQFRLWTGQDLPPVCRSLLEDALA